MGMAELQNTRWIVEAEITVEDQVAVWAKQMGFFGNLQTAYYPFAGETA